MHIFSKHISFLINKSYLLKDDEKVSTSIKKRFNSEPVYNEKYLKTKILQGIIQIFKIIKRPKEGFQRICLFVRTVDLVYRTSKSYYP